MLEVMAGPHPRDPTTHPFGFRRQPSFDIKGLRVAFSPDLGHARVDPEIAQCVANAVLAFERMGAHIEQIAPRWGPTGPALIRDLWAPAFTSATPANAAAAEQMDAGLVACLRDTAGKTWPDVYAATGRRLAYATEVGLWFDEGWDLLVTPTASVTAFPHGRQQPEHWPQHAWDWLTWAEFTYPFNLSHCPAISVPAGLSPDGLPIGLQIVGPRFTDARVLRAAAAFLDARPFKSAPPPPTA